MKLEIAATGLPPVAGDNSRRPLPVTTTETRVGGEPHLEAFFVQPDRTAANAPALLLCHGFPSKQRPGIPSRSYEQFAERLAEEQGWLVLAVSLRGCGQSEGQFSMEGWLDDVRRSVAHLRNEGSQRIWLVGSTTGGSLAIMAAAQDPEIRGIAVMAPRADFDDWASDPRRFLQHCRNVGVVKDESYPDSVQQWSQQLRKHRAIDFVESIGSRPMLILHGTNDRQVPPADARQLASLHPNPELRLVNGADHRIRHDPRAVAVLMGWLEQQAIEG